jgi:hypothetical protein
MSGYVKPQKAEQSFDSKVTPASEHVYAPQPFTPDTITRVPMSTDALRRQGDQKDGQVPV